MSELKAYIKPIKKSMMGNTIVGQAYYLKSEADKVIVEKDKVIAYAQALVLKDIEIIRHHKYKRCMAMAGRCRLRGRLFGACGLYEKELWALKWHKRWLELADKFKEAR